MQCPYNELYNDPEFSEDSYSEEDYQALERNCPCRTCLEREGKFNNTRSKPLEKEKPVDYPCCTCIDKKKEKPKVKGKFGLAYVVQTPKENTFKPLGWQVEFQDTPSQIDRNCEKMLKWVRCPPLGECDNVEADFLWCPSECKELLKSKETKKCSGEQKPIEKCCFIEIPKVKYLALEAKQTCICHTQGHTSLAKDDKQKCSCSRSKQQKQKCVCATKNKTHYEHRDAKNNNFRIQEQFEQFMLCNKCCKALTKCTCGQSVSTNISRERKQLKCKCRYRSPSKYTNREGEQDVLNVCKHCRKLKSYYCTIEERICPSCGKVMEKNCYVKENSVCESGDDSLDYIPRREICSKRKCKQTRDGSAQVKPKDAPKIENETKRDTGTQKTAVRKPLVEEKPTQVETKPPVATKTIPSDKKLSPVKEKPAVMESKAPAETSTPRTENLNQEKEPQLEIKEDKAPIIGSEQEVQVQDLIVLDDVKPEPIKPKKFSTKGTDDEPSLLDRIKQAHHKQMHEIHPDVYM